MTLCFSARSVQSIMGAILNLKPLKLLKFVPISAGCLRSMLQSFTPVFSDFRPILLLKLQLCRTSECHAVPLFARGRMGTIIPHKRKSGSIGYHAQLLIKRKGAIVHRESRTFDREQAAAAWLGKRETELAKPGRP